MACDAMIRSTQFHPAGSWPEAEAVDSVTLDFDLRHRRRIALTTDAGHALLLDLPKAVALADGDGLRTETGQWVSVRAAAESLLEVSARDPHHLTRLAWHIGNRHVPAEIEAAVIRIRPDHVIAEMLRGLGATVREVHAPFQPERGAYAHHGGHGHDH